MTTSRTGLLEPAYILHARKYRDTSLILDLLTRTEGRHSVVVRGARGIRSKLRGRLELFTPILIASVGRGELKTSTAIDFPRPAWRLRGEALFLGLYVNELLYRLLGKFDPVPHLYDTYEELQKRLAGVFQKSGQGTSSSVLSVRQFELILLDELGYGIDFGHEAITGEVLDPERDYAFISGEGFHKANEDAENSMTGRDLLRIAAGDLEHIDSHGLRNITRRSLKELLGDKPLKSRSLFRGVER